MKFLVSLVTSLLNFLFFLSFFALRFLKARKFDMDKALNMFTEMLSWRKDNNIDTIMQVMWEDIYLFIYMFIVLRFSTRMFQT